MEDDEEEDEDTTIDGAKDNDKGDTMSIDFPSAPIVPQTMSPDLQAEDFDMRESDFSDSDASTIDLIWEDENDVVPPSFNLSTCARHPDDHSMLEEPPEPLLQPQQRDPMSFSKVYGSESEHR